MLNRKIISFDYETHLISSEHPAPKPVCISWADDKSDGLIIGMLEMETYLQEKLSDPNTTLIAHNLKFEMTVTYEWFPSLRELIWKAYEDKRLICTLVDEKIINNFANKVPQQLFGLAFLVKKYLKIDISEDKKNPDAWRLRYGELEGVPLKDWPQAAIDYAINDSVYTRQIHFLQDKFEHPLGYTSTRSDFVLALSANRGMEVDAGRVAILGKEVRDQLNPNYDYLIERGFGSICPLTGKFKNKAKLLREYIEENVENLERTPKGNIKIGSKSLEIYKPKNESDGHCKKILQTYVDLSVYDALIKTFIPRLESAAVEGLMRTNYNSVISTERTSSSGSNLYPSVNIQNAPRKTAGVTYDVRNCYKARKGFKFVSIDYGGLELASTAHHLYKVYGQSNMHDLLNSGPTPMDLHSNFAAQVMSIETGRKISYEYFLEHKHEEEFDNYRQICKALNLGFPGGIGYVVMGTQLWQRGIELKTETLKGPDNKPLIAITEKQAVYLLRMARKHNPNIRLQRIAKRAWIFIIDELVGLKERYFEMYPRMREFLKTTHNQFLTGEFKMKKSEFDPNEWEKEPLYKYKVAGIRRNYAEYTQFCNAFLMQSPSAIGAKKMLWDVSHKFRDNPDMNIVAFIHDEIVIEVRDNEAFEGTVDSVAHLMITSMQKTLPSVRINVEADAMTYWSKKGDGSFSRLYWGDPGKKELHFQ